MKITDKREDKIVTFDSIPIGDFFECKDKIYMKTEDLYLQVSETDNMYVITLDDYTNAVLMYNGPEHPYNVARKFKKNDKVRPLKTELVIY